MTASAAPSAVTNVGLQDIEGFIGRGQHELVGWTVGVRLGLRGRGGRQAQKARESQALQQGGKRK